MESGGRRPRGRDRGDAEARLYRRGLRHGRRGAPARRCRRQLRLRRPSAGVERGCPRRRDARARALCGRRPAVHRRVVHTRERRAARASGGGRHGDRTDAQAGRPPAVAGYVARRDAVGSLRRRVGPRRSRRGICAGGGWCAPLDRGRRRRRPRAGAAAADPVRRRLLPKLLPGRHGHREPAGVLDSRVQRPPARAHMSTATLSAWNPGADGPVLAMAGNVGQIDAGGAFTTVHGAAQQGIASSAAPASRSPRRRT